MELAHTGVVYEESDNNCRLAMRRLTCIREVDIPGLDQNLRMNQRNYLTEHYHCIKALLRFTHGRHDYAPTLEDAAFSLKDLPHPKLELRRQAIKELWDSGDVAQTTWLRSVNWKFKKAELAKPGKYPRNIVDLGVSASLQTAAIADSSKHFLNDNLLIIGDCCLEIAIKPSLVELTRQLKMLFDHPYRIYMVAFSDDSCISVRIGSTIHVFNSDFKSCDTSHTPSIFHCMMDTLNYPKEFRDAILGQIMAPIRIYSVEDRSKMVMLRPLQLYLQSGIGITTLINDFAEIVFFHSLANSDISTPQDIIEAAQTCGYLVELQPCEKYEDAQFLKHSLALNTDNEYVATLNLGVILRCSGRAKYTIPGKGTYLERAYNHQHALMSGCLHSISNPTLEKLSPRPLNRQHAVYPDALRHLDLNESQVHRYHFEDLVRRYDLTECEIGELQELISISGYSTVVYSTGLTKIFEKDYGLTCPVIG